LGGETDANEGTPISDSGSSATWRRKLASLTLTPTNPGHDHERDDGSPERPRTATREQTPSASGSSAARWSRARPVARCRRRSSTVTRSRPRSGCTTR
jgi:hypothetical protein